MYEVFIVFDGFLSVGNSFLDLWGMWIRVLKDSLECKKNLHTIWYCCMYLFYAGKGAAGTRLYSELWPCSRHQQGLQKHKEL